MRCRYYQNPRIQLNYIPEKHLQHPTKLQAVSYQQKVIDFETSAIVLMLLLQNVTMQMLCSWGTWNKRAVFACQHAAVPRQLTF